MLQHSLNDYFVGVHTRVFEVQDEQLLMLQTVKVLPFQLKLDADEMILPSTAATLIAIDSTLQLIVVQLNDFKWADALPDVVLVRGRARKITWAYAPAGLKQTTSNQVVKVMAEEIGFEVPITISRNYIRKVKHCPLIQSMTDVLSPETPAAVAILEFRKLRERDGRKEVVFHDGTTAFVSGRLIEEIREAHNDVPSFSALAFHPRMKMGRITFDSWVVPLFEKAELPIWIQRTIALQYVPPELSSPTHLLTEEEYDQLIFEAPFREWMREKRGSSSS